LNRSGENIKEKKDKVKVITVTLSQLGYDIVREACKSVIAIAAFIDGVKRREEARPEVLERNRKM
jgi:hypothetical protein